MSNHSENKLRNPLIIWGFSLTLLVAFGFTLQSFKTEICLYLGLLGLIVTLTLFGAKSLPVMIPRLLLTAILLLNLFYVTLTPAFTFLFPDKSAYGQHISMSMHWAYALITGCFVTPFILFFIAPSLRTSSLQIKITAFVFTAMCFYFYLIKVIR